MVETGFELWSALLEGLLCDTVYAILPILKKLTSQVHFTEQMKLIVQQRNLILDFFSIISFTGAEGIKFMLEKSMKLLGPLLRQWKWLVGSQISWESHCNHIEPYFLWWEDRSRGEREGKILFFFFLNLIAVLPSWLLLV